MIHSAHDISEGGLFVALMESGMPNNLGFDIETDASLRKDAYLFGESQSRVVVSVKPTEVPYFEEFMNNHKATYSKIGRVLGERIRIDGEGWGNITPWKTSYDSLLGTIMDESFD